MSGKLTETQKQSIRNWLDERRKVVPCPSCGANQYTLADHFVAPTVFSDGGVVFGGESYPHFMLICDNCGLTQFYNAVVSGVMK